MKLRNMLFSSALILGLVAGGVTVAQEVDFSRHPNLAEAQHLIDKAYEKISQAQGANEWDMDGHAAKAKELLMQANHEIKEAARAANHHHHD
jgi:hypothetical protein